MLHKPFLYRSYHSFHSILRRKLNKTAFDHFYSCEHCGSHIDLEIHIPDMSKANLNNKGSWIILCNACHKSKHKSRI